MIINLTKKVPVVLVALAVSGSVFAGPDMETRLQSLEQQMKQVRTDTAFGTYGAKTASARAEVDGQGLFISADALYWHAKVGGTEYAYSDADTVFGVPAQGRLKDVDFDWDWGFRFGIGYNFDHDGWDTYLNFTYFNSGDTSSLGSGSNSSLVPLKGSAQVVGSSGFNCLTATSNFNFDYENLDLELGRSYFVSHSLSFRPHFGLRNTWLDQNQHTQYTGGSPLFNNTFHVKDSGDVWGIGPRAGFNSKWCLSNGFSIFGNASGALLYGYYQVHHKEWLSNVPLGTTLKINGNMHRFTPNAQMALGLCYDRYICSNKQHFSISLGYEVNYYWRLNQMIQAVDEATLQFNRYSEDVSMYGITLDLRLDF